MNASLLSMPADVLTHIALETVSTSSCITTLKDLGSLRSLALACRRTHSILSASNNPYLYGQVFRLAWDVDPIKRRFGPSAVVSSALAGELQRRFCTLKRIRRRLTAPSQEESTDGSSSDFVAHLVLLFLMMTENDGKNRHQIRDILGSFGVADLCFDLLSRKRALFSQMDACRSSHDITLILALLWMNTEDSITREAELGRGDEMLDFLEPIVLGRLPVCSVSIDLAYFGLQCCFTFPSPVPYARLCTAERYDAIKRRISPVNAADRHSWSCSTRFDRDCARLVTINPPYTAQKSPNTKSINILPRSRMDISSTIESRWSGGWYVPCPMGPSAIVMVYRAIQCQLREYVCTDPAKSVAYADGGEDEVKLARAWFNEGVEITEDPTSLTIYDPYTARRSIYEPRSESHGSNMNMIDRIFVGETQTEDITDSEAYKLHGRIHPTDGRAVLLRTPADMGTGDLGLWIFHGYIYGENDFVGDWTNTSTAKDGPAGSGWFRLTRDAHTEFF